MKNHGWAAALVLLALLIVGASAGRSSDDKVLEEIRDTLRDMRRVQILEVHPRVFSGHPAAEGCDLAGVCAAREREMADTKAAIQAEQREVLNGIQQRKSMWVTAGSERTAEWHGKIYMRHTMGPACDFGRDCDLDEWIAHVRALQERKKK